MTADELRALDAEVHTKVMGRMVNVIPSDRLVYTGSGSESHEDAETGEDVPPYSTDIAAAWLVVEKLTGFGSDRYPRGLALVLSGGSLDEGCTVTFECRKWGTEVCEAAADTAPLAICRAALKAVESVPGRG